jgi:hypothetical protein
MLISILTVHIPIIIPGSLHLFRTAKKDAPASGASSKPLRTASAMLLSQRQNEEMAIFDMDMSKNL